MRRAIYPIGVACVVAAVAVTFIVVWRSPAGAPTPAERAAIRSVIERWLAADSPTITPSMRSPSHTAALTPSAYAAAVAHTKIVLRAVGTPEFVHQIGADFEVGTLQKSAAAGLVVTQQEHKILTMHFQGAKGNGDLRFYVRIWGGETRLTANPAGGRPVTTRIDTSPVYEYVVRKVGGAWKIVSARLYIDSSDADPTRYGPNTPHADGPPEW